jgi:hypothetical protein
MLEAQEVIPEPIGNKLMASSLMATGYGGVTGMQ